MTQFNLSEWALGHRSFVVYCMIAVVAAGLLSYYRLGRNEDPAFTFRTMIVQAAWPGATLNDTLDQVTERIERKLKETPNLDFLRSFTSAGRTTIFVSLKGSTPPKDVPIIAKARGIESGAPFYMVPLSMLRDIVAGYQEAGVDYVYAYLTGYKAPPDKLKVPDGMNYNRAFPSPHLTAMPEPFAGGAGLVKYDDGTPETVDNYARDVTAFLAWAADPRLEERKRLGILVMGYLLITAILLYLAKRRIWSKAH